MAQYFEEKTNNKRHNTYKNKAKHSTQKKRHSIEEKKAPYLEKEEEKKNPQQCLPTCL